MSHNPPYKSETRTVVIGSPMEFGAFVPPRGPTGGRNVIDKFEICVAGTITVATLAWQGEDVPRIFQNVRVEDRSGKARWSLSGYKTRITSILLNGIEEHMEHTDVAIGAAQAVDLRQLVPMTKPMIVRGKDFALPSDLLGKISLDFASYAGAATSTTVLSAATLTCYVLAHCHEEHAVEFKAEDTVKSVDFNSNTQAKLAPAGAIHDLFVVKESTGAGGDVITAITDARIDALGAPTLTRLDLVSAFTRKRKLGNSAFGATPGAERFLDPVRSGMALPILTADAETSVWDGKVVEDVRVDVGTGAAGLSVISREITEKSQANYNAQIARFKIDPNTLKMKTEAKSRQGLGDGWSPRQRLVGVWKASLRGA